MNKEIYQNLEYLAKTQDTDVIASEHEYYTYRCTMEYKPNLPMSKQSTDFKRACMYRDVLALILLSHGK